MEPTPKSPALASMCETLWSRTTAITTMHCAQPPMGCGRELTSEEIASWPMATVRDYRITAMCWSCQREFYGETDECTCDEPCCSVDVGVGVNITCGSQHCPVHGERAEDINHD